MQLTRKQKLDAITNLDECTAQIQRSMDRMDAAEYVARSILASLDYYKALPLLGEIAVRRIERECQQIIHRYDRP